MADHLRAELVLDPLEIAVWTRRPAPCLVHHSNHGCQYTSLAFGQRCCQGGIALSMGADGACHDSVCAAGFLATLECELIPRSRWRTRNEAFMAICDCLETLHNPRRRYSPWPS